MQISVKIELLKILNLMRNWQNLKEMLLGLTGRTGFVKL